MALGPAGNFQNCGPRNRRHVDLTSQKGCYQADYCSTIEIGTLSFKDVMLFNMHNCIQISGRTLILTRFSLAGNSQKLPVLYTPWDSNFDPSCFLYRSSAMTDFSGFFNDSPAAATIRALGNVHRRTVSGFLDLPDLS